MKFDFCIGNPPYQEQAPGESVSDKPVYHMFMDAAFEVADKVELITPARFLSNAGSTPKDWNQKMLSDKHFKVLHYEKNTQDIFPKVTFPGGVAITMHDSNKEFEPIGTFSPFEELNSIKKKVCGRDDFEGLNTIISKRDEYLFTEAMHNDFPSAVEKLSDGHPNDISSNIFERLPEVFVESEPDSDGYYRVLGLYQRKRAYRWIKKEYVRERNPKNIGYWKVFLPAANGSSGSLGDEPARLISKPVIAMPFDVAAETFISVGAFEKQSEAEAALKYLQSKLARVMLGILKVTPNNTSDKWIYAPLQDFSDKSDIDWSVPIKNIDKQLYKKYNLTDEEIEFIETHVKEME